MLEFLSEIFFYIFTADVKSLREENPRRTYLFKKRLITFLAGCLLGATLGELCVWVLSDENLDRTTIYLKNSLVVTALFLLFLLIIGKRDKNRKIVEIYKYIFSLFIIKLIALVTINLN